MRMAPSEAGENNVHGGDALQWCRRAGGADHPGAGGGHDPAVEPMLEVMRRRHYFGDAPDAILADAPE
jgi:hypothetical protein